MRSYKLEILDSIPEGETITRYYIGSPDGGRLPDVGEKLKAALPEPSLIKPVKIFKSVSWWDLCAGPHIKYTGEINPKAFVLESVAGAYWRGDETKAQLQRIYGTAWENPEQLEAYLQQQEEAKRRDHRKLGKDLKLLSIQEGAGGGLVFWHPRGVTMRYIGAF